MDDSMVLSSMIWTFLHLLCMIIIIILFLCSFLLYSYACVCLLEKLITRKYFFRVNRLLIKKTRRTFVIGSFVFQWWVIVSHLSCFFSSLLFVFFLTFFFTVHLLKRNGKKTNVVQLERKNDSLCIVFDF